MKLGRVVVVVILAAGCAGPWTGCATVAPAPAPLAVKPAPVEEKPPLPPPVVEEKPEPVAEAPAPVVEAPPAPPAAKPSEEGLASYYADSLAGRRTASGERYRPDRATCAHRTLPFGTVLEVTAVSSGRTASCRVNDRGPQKKTRVLDVSKKVAKELGMLGPGVLRVRFSVKEKEKGAS